MSISDDVLKAAASALSDAARAENIYLPIAKARRMVEPALEAAIAIIRQKSPYLRIEGAGALIRSAVDTRRLPP